MKPKFIDAIVMCAGLTASNFAYQFAKSGDYATAFERSFFQCVAVVIFWLVWRMK